MLWEKLKYTEKTTKITFLISKHQINWEILLNFLGLLKIYEFYMDNGVTAKKVVGKIKYFVKNHLIYVKMLEVRFI